MSDQNTYSLTPDLDRWRGWRVEVASTDGTRRRFIVGRSTGRCPVNLEIARRNCLGGSPAYLAPGDTVRPLYRVW